MTIYLDCDQNTLIRLRRCSDCSATLTGSLILHRMIDHDVAKIIWVTCMFVDNENIDSKDHLQAIFVS